MNSLVENLSELYQQHCAEYIDKTVTAYNDHCAYYVDYAIAAAMNIYREHQTELGSLAIGVVICLWVYRYFKIQADVNQWKDVADYWKDKAGETINLRTGVLLQLAEYQNTGKTPQQIREFNKLRATSLKNHQKRLKHVKDFLKDTRKLKDALEDEIRGLKVELTESMRESSLLADKLDAVRAACDTEERAARKITNIKELLVPSESSSEDDSDSDEDYDEKSKVCFDESDHEKKKPLYLRRKISKSRPRSAYMHFCAKNRQTIKEELIGATPVEITCELGKRWKTMTPYQQKPYREMAKAENLEYSHAMGAGC